MGEKEGTIARGGWLTWIGANAAGWLAGYAVAQLFARVLFASDSLIQSGLEESDYIWMGPLDSLVGSLIYGLIIGAILGLCQAYVLRKKLDIKSQSWVGATMAGMALYWLLISVYLQVLLANVDRPAGLAGIGGLGALCGSAILPALPQWLVLRSRYARAGWWLLASIIGLPLANPRGGASGLLQWLFITLIAGGAYGLLTALALNALSEPGRKASEPADAVPNEEPSKGDVSGSQG